MLWVRGGDLSGFWLRRFFKDIGNSFFDLVVTFLRLKLIFLKMSRWLFWSLSGVFKDFGHYFQRFPRSHFQDQLFRQFCPSIFYRSPFSPSTFSVSFLIFRTSIFTFMVDFLGSDPFKFYRQPLPSIKKNFNHFLIKKN